MASSYPGRDIRPSFGHGSTVHVSFGGDGLLKRSLSEIQRQQNMQHALLRSVKQRIDTNSHSGFGFRNPNPPHVPDKNSAMQNQLEELERQLLDDDDTDDADVVSAVTTIDWSDAIRPPTTSTHSPSTSSSSCSSSTSCLLNSSRQLLLDTAAAIAEGNYDAAATNLTVLKRSANPRGDPEQRLTAIMLSALVNRTADAHRCIELCSLEHQTGMQMLYDISPCFKSALMTANLAILDATRESSKIHIVDFDIGQGGQYAALIHAVAERARQVPSLAPPSIKITSVTDPTFQFNSVNTTNNLNIIGDKIAKLSNRLGLNVTFNIVNQKVSDLELKTEHDEALAVNFAFALSKIADESVSPANPRDELLRRVKSLSPTVVTMVEQDINFNTAPFPSRFNQACSYYGSVLESLDANIVRDSVDRARVEACLGRKVANAVSNEGAERIERQEVFGKWRARMGMAGLKPMMFGPAVVEPVRSRFGSGRSDARFTLEEEMGGFGLGFGWMGKVLTVASVWR